VKWSGQGPQCYFFHPSLGVFFVVAGTWLALKISNHSYDPRQGRSGQYRYQRNLSANYWRVPASFILSVSLRGKGKLSGCVRVLPLSCLHLGFYRNRKLEIQGG